VQEDASERRRRPKGADRRHLHVIGGRRVEGAITTDADDRLAVACDRHCGFRFAPRRFLDTRRGVRRDAVDLRGMKKRERAQQRNDLPLVLVGAIAITDLDTLVEEAWCAARALADPPTAIGSLFESRPARIAAHEGER